MFYTDINDSSHLIYQKSNTTISEGQKIQSDAMFAFKATILSPDKSIKCALLILSYYASFKTCSSLKFKAEQINSDCAALLFIKTLNKENKDQFTIISRSRNMARTEQEKTIYEGICAGVRTDFFNNYFETKDLSLESMEAKLAEQYKGGAPDKAQEGQVKLGQALRAPPAEMQHVDVRYEKADMADMLSNVRGITKESLEHIKGLNDMGRPMSEKTKKEKLKLHDYVSKMQEKLKYLRTERHVLYPDCIFLVNNQSSSFFFNPIDERAPTDKEMIEELSKASTGFYGVDITSGKVEHAISVVIEDDPKNTGSKLYYIQDPNIGLIKCQNSESFKKTLEIILNTYPPPKKNKSIQDNTSHFMYCFQIARAKEGTIPEVSLRKVDEDRLQDKAIQRN